MDIRKEYIENTIIKTIQMVSDKLLVDKTTNLFMDVGVFDMLYIFIELEKKLGLSIEKLLMDSDYTVMSIENLTEKIYTNIA